MPREEIPDVDFKPYLDRGFEFEIMKLKSLVERVPHSALQSFHRHNFNVLLVLTTGEGSHFVDFEEILYNDKSVLFIADRQVHSFVVNDTADGFLLLFTNRYLYQSDEDLKNLRLALNPALSAAKTDVLEGREAILQLCYLIQSEYIESSKDPLKEVIIRHLLRAILCLIEREKQGQRVEINSELLRFIEQVDMDFSRTRNVEDYARRLRTTTRRLNELTRPSFGKGAKEFIDERVILESMRLLGHTERSIKDISGEVGFSDPTNFVKFFKKHTGEGPGEFRLRSRGSS